jgi:thiosulfate/3-mercaptopyruvate sulfurtransferase
MRNFVTTEWLAAHLQDSGLVVVDGSWYLPGLKRDPMDEYLAAHIPGAVYFDIDEIADHSTDLPHMLPSSETFALHMTRLGIADGMKVVVYDGAGLFSAPRVWWTFRLFGVKDVSILEGGFPKWKSEGRPTESGMTKRAPTQFTAKKQKELVADLARVEKTLDTKSAQVVDSRPADRFRGEAPEPRPGIRSGHMPGAKNVPAGSLVKGGVLVSEQEIMAALNAGGVDTSKPVITSCGSGVSAAVLWLALDEIGKTPQALYDGSWSEWGTREDKPVATGKD